MISAADLIEEMLGDIKPIGDKDVYKLYPFFVRVGCVKMAAPRHPRFEYIKELGSGIIDNIFTGRELPSFMTLVFPERHMSVHEQQQLMIAVLANPGVSKVKQVDILTSSPLIIGNFHRESIRILTWPDDEKHNGQL